MISLPFVITKYVEDVGWAFFVIIIAEFSFYALVRVAADLEQPFGQDANDLPLLDYQVDFDQTLICFLDPLSYKVPEVDLHRHPELHALVTDDSPPTGSRSSQHDYQKGSSIKKETIVRQEPHTKPEPALPVAPDQQVMHAACVE